MKKHLESSVAQIETTIGELVEALTQVSQDAGSSDKESYVLAAETLGHILARNEKVPADLQDERENYLHTLEYKVLQF